MTIIDSISASGAILAGRFALVTGGSEGGSTSKTGTFVLHRTAGPVARFGSLERDDAPVSYEVAFFWT